MEKNQFQLENDLLFPVQAHSAELELVECGKESCSSTKHNDSHRRDYYLFHLCVDGHGVFRVEGKEHRLGRGDLFLIAPGYTVEYYPDREDPWTYIWVGFRGSRAKDYVKQCGFFPEFVRSVDKNEFFMYFLNIADTFNREGALTLECLGNFYIILSRLIAKANASVQAAGSIREAHLREAVSFLKFNVDNDISVQDLANSLNLAPTYVINLFSELLKISPKQYLIRYRMQLAQKLLRSGYSVSAVSKRVGYKNPEQFSKRFKQEYGVSPKRFVMESRGRRGGAQGGQ